VPLAVVRKWRVGATNGELMTGLSIDPCGTCGSPPDPSERTASRMPSRGGKRMAARHSRIRTESSHRGLAAAL
jgi:hypothetical protein